MIDFEIIQVFSSIGVGLIGLLFATYFYFLIQKLFIRRLHNRNAFLDWLKDVLHRDLSKSGYTLVLSVLIYAFGILVQDMTDYMTDSDESKYGFARLFKTYNILPSEIELREDALVAGDSTLTPLGAEILALRGLNDFNSILPAQLARLPTDLQTDVRANWSVIGDTIRNDQSKNGLRKRFRQSVNEMYYTAKNWCYLSSEPAKEELQFIQNRIDFARSIFCLTLLSTFLLMLIFITYFTREILRGPQRFMVQENWSEQRICFYPRLSILILLPSLFILKYSYEVAEQNFNERAFGYYITAKRLESEKTRVKSVSEAGSRMMEPGAGTHQTEQALFRN